MRKGIFCLLSSPTFVHNLRNSLRKSFYVYNSWIGISCNIFVKYKSSKSVITGNYVVVVNIKLVTKVAFSHILSPVFWFYQ